VVVSYGGERATIQYNRNAISTREWREIRKRSRGEGEEADDEFSVAVLSRLIVAWDVMEGDGPKAKPLPHTKESLDELPPAFLNEVVQAIVADLYPKPEMASGSGSFS
jgi:hypothetical protein